MRSLTKPNCSTNFSQTSLSTMADVGWPEGDHFALVGKHGARDEIDEGFGRGQIEADQRGTRARLDPKMAHAKRPQRAVLLFDVVQLERGSRVRHSGSRLTSETTLLLSRERADFHAQGHQVQRQAGIGDRRRGRRPAASRCRRWRQAAPVTIVTSIA